MSEKDKSKKDKKKEREEKKEEKKYEDWDGADFDKITDDGGITKKIIKEGTGVKPVDGNEVKINYEARYQKAVFDKNEDGKPFSVKIGAHSAIKGMEMGLKTMKVGEIARYVFRRKSGESNSY